MRLLGVLFVLLLALLPFAAAAQAPSYEVWVVDQADANMDGARIHIFSKASVGGAAWDNQREVVLLQPGAQGVGDGSGRAPAPAASSTTATATASSPTSRAATSRSSAPPTARSSPRSTSASRPTARSRRRTTRTSWSPTRTARSSPASRSDFAREQFTWERDADFDLKTIEGPDRPDNAPICPVHVRRQHARRRT